LGAVLVRQETALNERLTTKHVLDRLGFRSRESLRALVKAGRFPAPLKEPGSTFNFWMESEVDDYLKKFAAQRKAHVEQSQTDGAQATVAA